MRVDSGKETIEGMGRAAVSSKSGLTTILAADFAGSVTSGSPIEPLDVLVREGGKALARREGSSLRTLRRRFERGGVTLSEARLIRRCCMVINILQLKGVALRDVARLLGYSGAPALTRFVRREFGVPPGVLRQQLQAS